MKRVFKITNPNHLPLHITVQTDDEKLIKLLDQHAEEWMAKLTKHMFPETFGSWEELLGEHELYADDTPTTKDIDGSLVSFPTPNDEITDSSAT